MSGWSFPSRRSLLWQGLGWGLLGGTLSLTAWYILQGPGRLSKHSGGDPWDPSMVGTRGTLTENLGPNRLVLDYQSIEGSEDDLQLKGVTGHLQDSGGLWTILSPQAHRKHEVWTLSAPMQLDLKSPEQAPLGHGWSEGAGEALQWDQGLWKSLLPLVWEGDQGPGPGRWHLPAGWTRQLDGRIQVEKGPVTWVATGPTTLKNLEAARLWATPGFSQGHLEDVKAKLEQGDMQAQVADLSPGTITWPAALHFQRADGWTGEAASGAAPRPAPGQPIQKVELKDFRARRAVPGGEEQVQAQGTRWTPAGLRLEGDVVWDQPYEGQTLTLKAPRVLMREAPGSDLPEELPVGHAVAESMPVLTWGARSLASPRMEVVRQTRQWNLEGPVRGRSEDGTLSGGAARGNPRAWTVQGPVQVNLSNGGQLRGSNLLWEEATWTLSGNPATWTRLRERLSGLRIIRKGDRLNFPEGVQGALAAQDGDLALRANQGQSDTGIVQLTGNVECQGQGWRLVADAVTVTLGPGRVVKNIHAAGSVALRGRHGEGQGEALDLSTDASGAQVVKWQGRVQGLGQSPTW